MLDSQNLQKLLSAKRLQSYKDLRAHDENLQLIGRLAPKILRIEIYLRNLIDERLGGENSDWIYQNENAFYEYEQCGNKKKKYFVKEAIDHAQKRSNSELDHNQLVSGFTLGFWLSALKNFQVGILLDVSKINMSDYCSSNHKNIDKTKYEKQIVIFTLIRNIRNRAFHAENLGKLDENGKPKIRAISNKKSFYVELKGLEKFVDDVLEVLESNP